MPGTRSGRTVVHDNNTVAFVLRGPDRLLLVMHTLSSIPQSFAALCGSAPIPTQPLKRREYHYMNFHMFGLTAYSYFVSGSVTQSPSTNVEIPPIHNLLHSSPPYLLSCLTALRPALTAILPPLLIALRLFAHPEKAFTIFFFLRSDALSLSPSHWPTRFPQSGHSALSHICWMSHSVSFGKMRLITLVRGTKLRKLYR